MALFNITSKELQIDEEIFREFRSSNMNIHIDTMNLRVSKYIITEEQWLGNL